jgi:sugar phosphate isomerase/epimerase
MAWTLSAFADEAGDASDDQLAALRDGGLHHIDLRGIDGHNISHLPVTRAREINRRFADAGIAVNMFGSPIGKIDIADDLNTDLQRLDHLARMRDVFGCNRVRVFSYLNRKHASKDRWRAQSMDNLRRLQERAGLLELVLFHENESHIFGDHSDDVLEVAKLRDGQTFGLIYDPANYVRTGEDGWETWQKLKDKTDAFHLKDQRTTGEHMPIGQGDTYARQILQDAATAGWTGPCTLEPHLRFSGAVIRTGPSGVGATSLADLSAAECFQVAVEAASELLGELGVR